MQNQTQERKTAASYLPSLCLIFQRRSLVVRITAAHDRARLLSSGEADLFGKVGGCFLPGKRRKRQWPLVLSRRDTLCRL